MSKSHTCSWWAASGLLLAVFLCPCAFASYAVPPENMATGVVEAINYVNHSITVNGHVYRISPKATYASDSVKNIGGLQTGMKIQIIANGPVANSKSKITNIVVLPPRSQ